MATITLGGNPIQTVGTLPQNGEKLVDFNLVAEDLSVKTNNDFAGKKVVFNIFPSVDTGTCAASVRRFNEEASALENTIVVNVSKDLPFALSRFCVAEGLKNVVNLSDFRTDFSKQVGVEMVDGPIKGLMSRSIIVVNENNEVVYTEQVPEIKDEPNYQNVLDVLKK